MIFRLFKRKKEIKLEDISLNEAKNRLIELINSEEENISSFISQKLPEAKSHIKTLILELEAFNPSALHPRLKGVGSSFKSSMLDLWQNIDVEEFSEVERGIEKTARMRVKHFRLLFAINPPELEGINRSLNNIASITKTVEERKAKTKIGRIGAALNRVYEIERMMKERRRLIEKLTKISSEIDRSREEKEQGNVLRDIESKIREIEGKIVERERKIHEKIAIAKKPIRIYAHMIGERVKIDLNDFADNRMTVLASNAALEIVKGNIKLKEKQVKAILASLKSISTGEIRREFEEIRGLKKELSSLKEDARKIQIKMSRNRQEIDRKRAMKEEAELTKERLKKIDENIYRIQKNLERELSYIFNEQIKLKLFSQSTL